MAPTIALENVLEFLSDNNRITNYLSLKRGPYFLAIQGVQGSGKTTLAKKLAATLRAAPWSLPTAVISLDDFYLAHKDQRALAEKHPDNPLIQHRGQASTHDIQLWRETFDNLRAGKPTVIPEYDKSCFSGQGDRVDASNWRQVNTTELVKVVIFEGWSVGFRSLPEDEVRRKWEAARNSNQVGSAFTSQLARNELEHVLFVNRAFKVEEEFNEYFSDLIQIDSDIPLVYKWRLQQEHALRASGKESMTDDAVRHFIDGYFPSYELYMDDLRLARWRTDQTEWKSRQVRLCVDNERQVTDCIMYD